MPMLNSNSRDGATTVCDSHGANEIKRKDGAMHTITGNIKRAVALKATKSTHAGGTLHTITGNPKRAVALKVTKSTHEGGTLHTLTGNPERAVALKVPKSTHEGSVAKRVCLARRVVDKKEEDYDKKELKNDSLAPAHSIFSARAASNKLVSAAMEAARTQFSDVDMKTPVAGESSMIGNSKCKSLASMVALELCAGSAGLSAALRRCGLDALGVDCARNPQKPLAPIIKADLAVPEGQDLIWEMLQSVDVVYVHIAVPCGTASKARERPIPLKLRKVGVPSPKPLRSPEHPWGLPSLSGLDKLRVTQANDIYRFSLQVVYWCQQRNILWSVENPTSSYVFELPEFRALQTLPGVYAYSFQQCCHGGERPAWRTWLSNILGLQDLVATCDGTHQHKEFGVRHDGTKWVFDTASEATYPRTLCNKVAAIVSQSLIAAGAMQMPTTFDDADKHPTLKRHKRRAMLGKFIRGNRLPQIISEFSTTVAISASELPNCKKN
jgi:hypothetical protein